MAWRHRSKQEKIHIGVIAFLSFALLCFIIAVIAMDLSYKAKIRKLNDDIDGYKTTTTTTMGTTDFTDSSDFSVSSDATNTTDTDAPGTTSTSTTTTTTTTTSTTTTTTTTPANKTAELSGQDYDGEEREEMELSVEDDSNMLMRRLRSVG